MMHYSELIECHEDNALQQSSQDETSQPSGWREYIKYLFCSDIFLKLYICLCFGLLPWRFKTHYQKRTYSFLTIFIALLQWSSLFSYVFFVFTYWNDEKYGPQMPEETKILQLGLVTSSTCTYTLIAIYFYSTKNNFENKAKFGFCITPRVPFPLEGAKTTLSRKEWLVTNLLLALGLTTSSIVIFVDFYWDTFYDFHGIHKFLPKISKLEQFHYHLSVSTEFLGFYGTVAAVCIFHVMSRDLINHIRFVEDYILKNASSRKDFLQCHQILYEYGKRLTSSIKYWFSMHCIFFFFLITGIIFEWFKLLQNSKGIHYSLYKLILAQISGSFMIAFKFAFPFISASSVTARYTTFYYRLSRACTLQHVPELGLLNEHAGFKILGIRITPKFALIAVFASFVGALKFITGLRLY